MRREREEGVNKVEQLEIQRNLNSEHEGAGAKSQPNQTFLSSREWPRRLQQQQQQHTSSTGAPRTYSLSYARTAWQPTTSLWNSIGMALADSLDALIASNDITPQLAVRIMERVCMPLLCLAWISNNIFHMVSMTALSRRFCAV